MSKEGIESYNKIISKHYLHGRERTTRRATTIRMRDKTMDEFNRCCGEFFNKTMGEVIEAIAEDFIREHRGEEFFREKILMPIGGGEQLDLPGLAQNADQGEISGWIPQSSQA